MKKTRKSLWVQIFFASKYFNEHLKNVMYKEYDLTPYEYFMLMNFRIYEDFTFYECNKYTPIDGKSLHTKVASFVEKGLMSREYIEDTTSILNLTTKARERISDVYNNALDDIENYFEEGELLELYSSLYEFNEKMRKLLDLEFSEDILNKRNMDLL